MKKILALICCFCLTLNVFSLMACGKEPDLRIYNCYDYIDETLLDEFVEYYFEKTGKEIKVEYSCFDTPEDAYNKLKVDPTKYDLLCPSDYMIEKMAVEGRLEEFSMPSDGNYATNLSPFVKERLESVTWEQGGEKKNLSNYAAGYMWGTIGLVYNPDKIDNEDDMKSFQSLWNTKYKNRFTIKDSVREAFFIGLSNYHYNELISAKEDLNYLERITALFNDTSSNTINQVKNSLFKLKENSLGMEVDEGKDQIVLGQIDVYLAWSGDAVYAIDEASNQDVVLKYSVPEEGSNVWFDGWCIPKNAKNKDLAIEFIDFLSKPTNVIKNMEYIGYVSCIAGDEVFDWVKDSYGVEEGAYTEDLSYFFGDGDYTVSYDELNGQFNAQYPSKTVLDRCAIMEYYPEDVNDAIMNMWMAVKTH